MKKNYFKPEVESVDIALGNIMLETSGFTSGGGKDEGGWGEQSNTHRGEWGNFWKK